MAEKFSKITTRIPRQQYSYIEVERGCNDADEEKIIVESMKKMIEDNALVENENKGNLEVIVDGQNCEVCGGRILEQIGISKKTNKPYHKLCCEHNIQIPKEVKPNINNEKVIETQKFVSGTVTINNEQKKYCNYLRWISVRSLEQ